MTEKSSYVAGATAESLEACVEGRKSFEEVLRDAVWPTGWSFRPYQNWSELLSWSGYNWKNFTLIAFEVEYADAMRPPGYVEVHMGILGVGIYVTYYGNASRWDQGEDKSDADTPTIESVPKSCSPDPSITEPE